MNRVIGAMTPNPPWPARYACAMYSHWNLGDPASYPEMLEEKQNLLNRFSNIVFGRQYPGELTSGATESNILALLYWRRKGKRRVVATPTTHYSIRKATEILGMEYSLVGESRITSADVVVITIGTTEYGGISPDPGIIEEARRVGAGVHVDAAYAGAIARYLGEPPVKGLDETVATMSVDLHKIPESPPPAGVLYTYDTEVLETLSWEAPYIPTSRQFGLLGTRPGCVVKAASVALRVTMEEYPGGPSKLASDLAGMVSKLAEELEPLGFQPIGGPYPVRCMLHDNTGRIIEGLKRRGISAYTCHGGRGIRIVAMPHYLWEGYEWMINEIRQALALL